MPNSYAAISFLSPSQMLFKKNIFCVSSWQQLDLRSNQHWMLSLKFDVFQNVLGWGVKFHQVPFLLHCHHARTNWFHLLVKIRVFTFFSFVTPFLLLKVSCGLDLSYIMQLFCIVQCTDFIRIEMPTNEHVILFFRFAKRIDKARATVFYNVFDDHGA